MIVRTHRTKMTAAGLRLLAVLSLLLATSFGAATSVTAQGDNQQYVDVRIYAVTCDAARSLCERELGPRFTVTTEDGTYLGDCTELSSRHPCTVRVPSGMLVVVTEDVSTIPAGTVPAENPLYFDTSAYPDAKSICCVVFENISNAPIDGSADTSVGQTSDIALFTEENGQSAYDACYVLVDYSNVGCDENGDGRVMFEDIPWGTYTVRQTADLGPGRFVDDFTIEVRGNINSAGFEAFSATIVNTTGGSSAPGESVDIALITRDPETGDLLTGACYVLVDYSNEGCDENGDGQVTFADIPFGTYTVHQTQTPAGYPTINDYDINVDPVQGLPGDSFVEPLGFVVKQAPEQNAPDTRNVSIVLVDYNTNQKIVADACVEIIGASNVGCDEDLIDGQIDFLDVPAGSHEFTFTQFPDGYTGAPFMNTSWLEIDPDSYDQPANVMIYVWLEASIGSVPIEPAQSSSSSDAQNPVSTSGVTNATVLMTLRGCPEGFVPDVDDPYVACTIPLDAPDASAVGEWGVGQSLVPITGLEREYDGSYIFHASSDGGYYLELTGLEPVLRDSFLIYGVDDQDGSSYITLLDNGETREVFIFYYYE